MRRLRSLLAVAALGCGLVSAIGCTANPPAPRAKPAPKPQGDELLARGDYEAAKAAYEREARLATSAERAARARFLRAMVRLAQQEPALAREELRSLERAAPGTIWPRLARLLSHELARADVLRQEVLDAGAELHEQRLQLQELERALEEARELLAAAESELQTTKEERLRLQALLRDAEERATAQAQRVRELEAAFEALKNIDMQREP